MPTVRESKSDSMISTSSRSKVKRNKLTSSVSAEVLSTDSKGNLRKRTGRIGKPIESLDYDDFTVVSMADSVELNVVNHIVFPLSRRPGNDTGNVTHEEEVPSLDDQAVKHDVSDHVEPPSGPEYEPFNMFPEHREPQEPWEVAFSDLLSRNCLSGLSTDDFRGLPIADIASCLLRHGALQSIIEAQNEDNEYNGDESDSDSDSDSDLYSDSDEEDDDDDDYDYDN